MSRIRVLVQSFLDMLKGLGRKSRTAIPTPRFPETLRKNEKMRRIKPEKPRRRRVAGQSSRLADRLRQVEPESPIESVYGEPQDNPWVGELPDQEILTHDEPVRFSDDHQYQQNDIHSQSVRPTENGTLFEATKDTPAGDEISGAAAKKSKTVSRQKKRSWKYRSARFVLYWGAVVSVWCGVLLASVVTIYALIAEDPLKAGFSKHPAKLSIVAENGKVIAEKGLRRDHMTIDRLPPHLVQAVLATEDRRFYYHFGFDPIGITRAVIENRRAGRIVQGGSTITQQLAKVLFLEPKRTYWRKIEEILLALSIEWRFTKDEILELYLNRIYFGAGNYGVEAAAQHYFGKSVSDIGLFEAAILAGLIKSPSYYAPTRNLERALNRGKLVLANMYDYGAITEQVYVATLFDPPELRSFLPTQSYGYIIDWVVNLVSAYGHSSDKDLIVETTIDYDLQGEAQQIVSRNMNEHGENFSAGQGAAVVLDRFGGVKALVGGKNYARNQFNRAVQSRRQPGSTFKPFVFLAALERGLTPESLVYDGPIQIGDWIPKNYNNRYYGDVTLRRALAKSLNTVSVRLAQWVGSDRVVRAAHRLGVNSKLKSHPSIALGTSEVSLLELTNAYVPFSNGGIGVQSHIIKSIKSSDGQVLFRRKSSSFGRVIPPHLVSAMNDMLSATIIAGTGKQASIDPHPIAGKTGTGQSYRDAWFVGYSAHYVTGVWIGNDDFTPMKRVTGGSLPTFIWRDLMQSAHNGKQPAALPGHNWRLAGNWAPRRKQSFWESIFNPTPARDRILGGDSRSSYGRPTSRREEIERWRDRVLNSSD